MKKHLAALTIGALAMVACGSDDDGGGDPADRIVAAFNDLIESDPDLAGASVDESCIRANMVGIPDDDLAKIATALETDTEPEGLGPEAEQASVDVIGCFDFGG